jgi:hypothetical protein
MFGVRRFATFSVLAAKPKIYRVLYSHMAAPAFALNLQSLRFLCSRDAKHFENKSLTNGHAVNNKEQDPVTIEREARRLLRELKAEALLENRPEVSDDESEPAMSVIDMAVSGYEARRAVICVHDVTAEFSH